MRGRKSLLLAVVAVAAPLVAQVSPPEQPPSSLQPGAEGAQGSEEKVELGAPFESQAASVALRPPAGMKMISRAGNPDEIVKYVDDKRQWAMTVSRLRFSREMPLTSRGDTPGLLELSTEKLKEGGSAEVLRSDVTNVGSGQMPDTGIIIARFATGTKTQLMQQALVQSSETLYYVVELISPGSKPGSGEAVTEDERRAVNTFKAVVDSLKPLDRSDVKAAQIDRMYATRALFTNWTAERTRAALLQEHWLRLMKDGKDVGYSYVVEEEERRAGRPGVLIGVRSRSKPGGPVSPEQVDAESLMFVSFDRKYEEWSNVAQFTGLDGKKTSQTEIGSSSLLTRKQLLPEFKGEVLPNKKGEDEKQPGVREIEERKLTVTYGGGAPLELTPGVTYISQATIQMLPRLVPLKEQKKYIFSTYVGERRDLYFRYIDVLPETDVVLDGKKLRAIPVSERIGLEGIPNMHYMSRDGRYLGTVNEKAKITVLPTDPATLQKIWSNPDFSRPKPPPGPTYTQPEEGAAPRAPR